MKLKIVVIIEVVGKEDLWGGLWDPFLVPFGVNGTVFWAFIGVRGGLDEDTQYIYLFI